LSKASGAFVKVTGAFFKAARAMALEEGNVRIEKYDGNYFGF